MPNKSNTYYIQIFIEKWRTTYYKKKKKTQEIEQTKSLAGHMWFRIFKVDERGNIIKGSI